jgi:hypothetical protein
MNMHGTAPWWGCLIIVGLFLALAQCAIGYMLYSRDPVGFKTRFCFVWRRRIGRFMPIWKWITNER